MKPEYFSNFVEDADKALEHLLTLEWLNATEARQEYFMADQPRIYVYGKGTGVREYASKEFTSVVKDILEQLNTRCGTEYNVCFLNRYNDQRQHLGWHADDGLHMDGNHPIASVSFGAEREIWWKPKADKGEVPPHQRQLLGHGSLFVMPSGFQELFYHKIPKCDKACGIRISLTFRKWSDS